MNVGDKTYNATAKVAGFFAWLSVIAFSIFLLIVLYAVAVIVF